MLRSELDRLIVTEGTSEWYLNIDKYNSEDDIKIPKELAEKILELKGKK